MKGGPPKSDDLKALQGNAGKRAKATPKVDGADRVEVMPDAVSQKNPPEVFFSPGWAPAAWLPDGAKEVWRHLLPIALRETKLQESGLQVFAVYCDAVYRMQKYTREIETEGATYKTESGYIRKRPEVEMRDKAANDVRNFAAELNLTPKSWINSMGTFSGRQLDMFMNGGRAAEPMPETPGAPVKPGESLDAFLGAKPTIQ
jgi:P27 family predicted phage terminase small subunit